MRKVDLLHTTDDGREVSFTVGLTDDGGLQVVSGDREAAEYLGVPGRPIVGLGGRVVSPEDPEAYLEALRWQFIGSRVRVTGPYES